MSEARFEVLNRPRAQSSALRQVSLGEAGADPRLA
jgi:hypothetical protein